VAARLHRRLPGTGRDGLMPAPRHITVVTYYFPPATAIGAHRWASMARHLRALGHEVTVVTSTIHGALPDDAGRVLRTGDLGNAAALRSLLRRPALPAPGSVPALTSAPAVLTQVVPPDSHLVSWVPSALAAVLRLARRRPIDCLITSGPPDSSHLLPLLLGRLRPPWIADFRDGWRFEPLRDAPWPTRAQVRLDARLERRVARTAEVVVGATLPIAEDFADRLGADAHWVSNGFDPATAVAADGAVRESGWLTLVHTGTLSGPRGRDPRPFLSALEAFNASRAAGDQRIRLVLAGRPSADDERLLALASTGRAVHPLGLIDRPASLALQRGADALLLLTGNHRSEATGKLFEYLASGRPILALAEGNEAARIVRETGTGVAVPSGSPEAIRAALDALADGSLEAAYAPRGLERFRYPGPARAIEALVERAVGKRAAQGR